MKKAATALGIIGGAIPLIFLIVVLFAGKSAHMPVYGIDLEHIDFTDTDMFIPIIVGLALGIIGGSIVYVNNIAGGILMIIGSLLSSINIILLLGGIFALREKPAVYPQYAHYLYRKPPPPRQGSNE